MMPPIVTPQAVYEYHAALRSQGEPAPTLKTAHFFNIGTRHVRRLIEDYRLNSRPVAGGGPLPPAGRLPGAADLRYSVLIVELRRLRSQLDVMLELLSSSV